MNQSLTVTVAGLKGTIAVDDTLDMVVRRVVGNRVSEIWRRFAFPFVLTLRACICDLGMRVDFMDLWIKQGSLICFIIRPFFHLEQFFTAGL
jgi:hypothetical protein